jgi:hypothetical protein
VEFGGMQKFIIQRIVQYKSPAHLIKTRVQGYYFVGIFFTFLNSSDNNSGKMVIYLFIYRIAARNIAF